MVIGVCGFGYSGSGAVWDYLREVESLRVLDAFELSLVRSQDGLLDLEYHIEAHRGEDFAMRRFLDYMNEIATFRIKDPEVRRRFRELVREYADSLIEHRWKATLPAWYANHEIPRSPHWMRLLEGAADRLHVPAAASKRAGLRHASAAVRRKLAGRIRRFVFRKKCREFDMYLVARPEGFLEKTREFVARVIDLLAPGEGEDFVVDQPFPTADPGSAFRFFSDPKAIVVWRDPRDLYALQKNVYHVNWVPTDDVKSFVESYTYYYEDARRRAKEPGNGEERVLHVWFEDLIYKYEETTRRIDDFLGIPRERHAHKRFDPKRSCVNTRLYERYPEDADAFAYIAENMKEFLYPFEKYPAMESDAKPF